MVWYESSVVLFGFVEVLVGCSSRLSGDTCYANSCARVGVAAEYFHSLLPTVSLRI